MHECRGLSDGTVLLTSSGVKRIGGITQSGAVIENSSLLHLDPKETKILNKKMIEDGQIV